MKLLNVRTAVVAASFFILATIGSTLSASPPGPTKQCASREFSSTETQSGPEWSRACHAADGDIIVKCASGGTHYLPADSAIERSVCDIPLGTNCTSKMFESENGVAKGCWLNNNTFYSWCRNGKQIAFPSLKGEISEDVCGEAKSQVAKTPGRPASSTSASPRWGEIFSKGALQIAGALADRKANASVSNSSSSNQSSSSSSSRAGGNCLPDEIYSPCIVDGRMQCHSLCPSGVSMGGVGPEGRTVDISGQYQCHRGAK